MTEEHGLRRRAADGKVYARIAKRQNTTDETWSRGATTLYHWCASESPELLTPDTPAHVCDIWAVADDQSEPQPRAIAEAIPTTDELIRRVLLFTEEQLTGEPAPLLWRTAVLALLRQTKAVEDIVVLLSDRRSRPPEPTSQSLDDPPHDVSQRDT